MASAVNTDAPGDDAQAPRDNAWPTVHSRRSALDDAGSVVDPADATAWSMPYTDLTMLLMVFFIVMLSVVGPDPSESTDVQDITSGGAAAMADDMRRDINGAADHDARTLFDGGDGILTDTVGLMPDGGTERIIDEHLYDDPPGDGDNPETRGPQASDTRPASPVLPGDAPLPSEDDFAAAWARRVNALEGAAAAFLDESGLADLITLNKTDTGIELRLPDNLLFSSGSSEVQTPGLDLLTRIAPFLKDVDGDIQISGHTDNVPIQTVRFPSNWELSAARAIAVVRLLRQMGIPETKMQAVGHGANRPIASNSHTLGRATNRRVTIDVTPRPGTAVSLP